MPFRVSGDHEDQRYFAEGLTEELIVELGRFRRISVRSRSASFAVADFHSDPVKLGEILGVRYLLEGQVRKIGERARSASRCRKPIRGRWLWSDKIQRSFEELLALVDETAARIAATVSGRMEDAAMMAARRKRPENMTALDYLLRGLDHHRLGGVTDDNARQSVSWFTKAIDADPNYAIAYAWRVCAASWLPDFDLEQGRRDIRHALELDPFDAEANRIMGTFELMNGNFDEALAHNRRAMDLESRRMPTSRQDAPLSSISLVRQSNRCPCLTRSKCSIRSFPCGASKNAGWLSTRWAVLPKPLNPLGKLTFQTNRSRLYRAASLVALDRADEASRVVRELSVASRISQSRDSSVEQYYRDPEKARELGRLLKEAGLPT